MADSISRQLLKQAAARRGYGVDYIDSEEYFLRISHPSGQRVVFRGTLTDKSSATGSLIARRKDLTLKVLAGTGISLPPFMIVGQADPVAFMQTHGTVVAKPSDATKSIGVTTDINDEAKLLAAIETAKKYSFRGEVILQKQVYGGLYRLFVVDGKLVAAAQRRAAEVTGDGHSTVKQLVGQLNQDPRRGSDGTTPLTNVNLKDVAAYKGEAFLQTVPDDGERVRVSALDSISAGGESIDVTDDVHQSHRRYAEELAELLGLFVAGFDIITADISQPDEGHYWPLLEINSSPGLRLHHFPTGGGQVRDVAGYIVDHLF